MKKHCLVGMVLTSLMISLYSFSLGARIPLISQFGTDTTGTDPTKLDLSGGNVVLDTATQNWWVYYTQLDDSTTYFVYEPATRVSIVVQGEVSFDTINNNYTYKYTLNSLSSSVQNFKIFDLYDIASSVSNIVAPSGWYYLFSEGDTDIMWADTSTWLIPGTSTTGLQFKSAYLPSIVSCWSKGVVPDIVFPDEAEMEPDIVPGLEGDSVRGKTIGPKELLQPLGSPEASTTFINIMINYTNESYTQGWIESTTVRNSYINLLLDCRTAIENNYNRNATDDLQQLIDNAESDYSNQIILSEAYALLKYNAQYLKDSLPEGH
jgi:hypothetical protein